MRNSILNLEIEPLIKTKAERIANDLGIPLNLLVNAFLKNLITNRSVTFKVGTPEEPSEYMKKALREAEKSPSSPVFDDAEEAIAWLNNPKREYATD
jgi:antitoxin component of RelBE/YafQ-DinJ toxin-antitoxin module